MAETLAKKGCTLSGGLTAVDFPINKGLPCYGSGLMDTGGGSKLQPGRQLPHEWTEHPSAPCCKGAGRAEKQAKQPDIPRYVFFYRSIRPFFNFRRVAV